jgi:hypothetical protein
MREGGNPEILEMPGSQPSRMCVNLGSPKRILVAYSSNKPLVVIPAKAGIQAVLLDSG